MRLFLYRVFIFIGLSILVFSLFNIQVKQREYYQRLGDKNRIRLIPLEAPRGRVLDRHGRSMAINRASYDVIAMPEDVTGESLKELSDLLDIPLEVAQKRLKAPRESPFTPAVIAEDVGRDSAFKVEERQPYLHGISIRTSGRRSYPYGKVGSHMIGFIGKLTREEYLKYREDKDHFGYNSLIGKTGIERELDSRLRGVRGGKQIEVNSRGKMIRVLTEKNPQPGEDIVLTIDLELQKRIQEEALEDKQGAVAILDLKTEEILVLVSNPSFDANMFVSPGEDEARLLYLKDPNAPLLDRAVSSGYPPGSVFKIITSLAGLNTGKITTKTYVDSPATYKLSPGGRTYKCWNPNGHGSINVETALERSANVFFYKLGRRLGADTIAEYARKFGFGEKIDLPLTNVSAGLVPDTKWKKKIYKEKWYMGETLSFAIGQSYLLITPLQILRMVATVAKDGKKVNPVIVREGEAKIKNGKSVGIPLEHLRAVQRGMHRVVESDYGTGQLGRVDFGEMAAKTGSAQAPPKLSHAWMGGYFPYKNPEIAFVVFLEHGGSGGMNASAVAKKSLQIWRELYGPKVA
jgi:penicillin-binding protein 2